MSASGPGHDGPGEQEPLEELFGTVFDLAGEIASRISRDDVEARLRRTLEEAGHHQEQEPARTAARQDRAGTSTSRAAYSPMSEPSGMLGAAMNLPDDVASPPGETDWLEAVIDHLQKARQSRIAADPLMAISHLYQGEELYPRALAQAVEEAREAGKTWKEIAIFAGEKDEDRNFQPIWKRMTDMGVTKVRPRRGTEPGGVSSQE